MVFPPLTWVLLVVAAALCAIGFIKFVWFMSVGYGLAVGGIGVAIFAIAVIRGDLTPVMAVLCCLLLASACCHHREHHEKSEEKCCNLTDSFHFSFLHYSSRNICDPVLPVITAFI